MLQQKNETYVYFFKKFIKDFIQLKETLKDFDSFNIIVFDHFRIFIYFQRWMNWFYAENFISTNKVSVNIVTLLNRVYKSQIFLAVITQNLC